MHLLQLHRKNVSFWALFLTGLLVSLLAPRGWTVAEAFSILTILPHSDGEWIVPVQVTKTNIFNKIERRFPDYRPLRDLELGDD